MPAVVTGEAILGTAWKNPAGTTPSNEGSGFTGSKVEIYENSMVVITSPSGTRQVTTLSHITDLTLKPAVKNP